MMLLVLRHLDRVPVLHLHVPRTQILLVRHTRQGIVTRFITDAV